MLHLPTSDANRRNMFVLVFRFCLILLLNVVLAIGDAEDDDFTLFLLNLKKNDAYNITCVHTGPSLTNSIVWNNMDRQASVEVFDFVETNLSKENCDISSRVECTQLWKSTNWRVKQSVDFDFGNVLDYRWDGFHEKGDSSRTELLADLDDSNFELPLSITTGQTVISLCSNNFVDSGCYSVELSVWDQFRLTFCVNRKCENRSWQWFDDLNKFFWKDVLIRKNSTTLSVHYSESSFTHILDNQNQFQFRAALIASTKKWILHDYEFYHTTVSETATLTNKFQLSNVPYYCLSMFVVMCSNCQLKLSLVLDSGSVVNEQTFQFGTRRWEKIKFITEQRLAAGSYMVMVETVGEDAHRFWAIDYVKRCSKKDIRVQSKLVKLKDTPKCSLRNTNTRLHVVASEHVDEDRFHCNLKQFGKFCTDCGLIFGDAAPMCDRRSECYMMRGRVACNCRTGYFGTHCYNECSKNFFFGRGCTEKCGSCHPADSQKYPCDHITGMCKGGCEKDYSGPMCNAKTGQSIFLSPPIIVSVSYTEVVVKINNTDLRHNGDASWTYKFQYQKKYQNDWKSTETREYSLDDLTFTIKNLMKDTAYKVRSVFVEENDSYDNIFPVTYFRTLCRSYESKNINVKATENSVHVSYDHITDVCDSSQFEYVLRSDQRVVERNYGLFSNFDTLKSNTNYYLTINCFKTNEGLTMNFTTLPRKLFPVWNVQISPSESSVNVSWEPPRNADGPINYYKITYKELRNLKCVSGTDLDTSERKVNNTSVTISKLTPYSAYKLELVAYNGQNGFELNTQFNTTATDTVVQNELPSVTISLKTTDVQMQFSEKCQESRGPLTYSVMVTCLDDWCLNKTAVQNRTDQRQFFISNLIPYTNYSVETTFGRSGIHAMSHFKDLQYVRTHPTAPGPVENLEFYSVSIESVSIRWKPSKPPNGALKTYKISVESYRAIRYFSYLQTSEEPQRCTLWKEYYCHTFRTQDSSERWYRITIAGYNRDVSKESPSRTVVKEALKSGKPEVPLNVTCDYVDNDIIDFRWLHPFYPNAPIEQFKMNMSKKSYTISYLGENVLEYHHKINASKELSPSTTYESKIFATTKYKIDGKSAICKFSTAPLTPSLAGDLQIRRSMENETQLTIPIINQLDKNGYVYVLVTTQESATDLGEPKSLLSELKKVAGIAPSSFCWVAAEIKVKESKSFIFQFGDESRKKSGSRLKAEIYNPELVDGRSYTIKVVVMNEFKDLRRFCVAEHTWSFNSNVEPKDLEGSSNLIYLLLILLLLVPVAGYFVFRKHKAFDWRSAISMRLLIAGENNMDERPLTTTTNKSNSNNVIKPKLALKEQLSLGFSNPIKLPVLEHYVKESLRSGELDRQHKLFPRGQTKPWTYGMKPENKFKNRYNNLIAYDYTRVVLTKESQDEYSDYINANYIDGYNCPKAYIATQGPKPLTLSDFWKMIWQENVAHVIMLTNVIENEKKKCEKYWPDINDECSYGAITVRFESLTVHADFEHRVFKVVLQGTERKVEQLHFLSWPDHGVPLYAQSLVPFLKKVLTIPQGDGPIVVHCSAGVGRTGTIILCDICLRMAAREGCVDVLHHIHRLREQRPNMVDNTEQYKLVHLVLLECLNPTETAIECNEKIGAKIEDVLKNDVEKQLQYLQNSMWKDQAMQIMMMPAEEEDEQFAKKTFPQKNRFENIVPEPHLRLFISRYPHDDEAASYINAVKVDGFRNPNRFIVTQQPLPNTVLDFWRLVHEKDVTVIVSLNEIDSGNQTSCYYWPVEEHQGFNPVPHLCVQCAQVHEEPFFKMYTLHLFDVVNEELSNKRVIQLIEAKFWSSNSEIPRQPEVLLQVLEATDRFSHPDKPTVVTCFDGATASGLFIATSFVIDKVKREQVCDICLAVRTIRRERKQFIQSKKQFRYLYEIVLKYLEGFEIYSNFSSS